MPFPGPLELPGARVAHGTQRRHVLFRTLAQPEPLSVDLHHLEKSVVRLRIPAICCQGIPGRGLIGRSMPLSGRCSPRANEPNSSIRVA
jgi:hypothetical protein